MAVNGCACCSSGNAPTWYYQRIHWYGRHMESPAWPVICGGYAVYDGYFRRFFIQQAFPLSGYPSRIRLLHLMLPQVLYGTLSAKYFLSEHDQRRAFRGKLSQIR